MIDLTINKKQLERTVQRAKERNIIVPTFAQMRNPETIPQKIRDKLKTIGLWDFDSANLFRITWKNEPVAQGGGFGPVNTLEIPASITGVKARVIALVGKWFPTGAHKVGATFGCLVPRLVTGQFDPTTQKAVWPSTGNFCRGGAYDATLLGCESIAILPQNMSRERFEWLKKCSGEIIATPGCESNVKEIFDKCWELRKTRGDGVMIFNQFEEFGNHLWHYAVTGHAMEEAFRKNAGANGRLRGAAFTTGSAGTIGCGDYLKKVFPDCKIAASEALQCPTLLMNGFGDHRIEGIGDKHVPWIHNLKNTDVVTAIDDEACVSILRLFNEPTGKKVLARFKVPQEIIARLDLIGISGIANMLSAVKLVRWYEMSENDVVLTVLTDSTELYGSRLQELKAARGEYTEGQAEADYQRYLMGCTTDHTQELGYWDRKRVHNLKYFTWVEQQGRSHQEIQDQWYKEDYWTGVHGQMGQVDELINQFNDMTGLLKG